MMCFITIRKKPQLIKEENNLTFFNVVLLSQTLSNGLGFEFLNLMAYNTNLSELFY